MNKICIRSVVSGKVQGVYFRSTTQKKAFELGIQGFAKNLADGSVEVFACGERSAVLLLIEWLWQGPQTAKVSEVRWEEKPWEAFNSFEVQ